MHFDPTVTLGTLITVAATVGSVGLFAFKMLGRLAKMEYKLRIMWNQFKEEKHIEDEGNDE